MSRVTTVIRLPPDLLYCLKKEALEQRTSMNHLIVRCLLECQKSGYNKKDKEKKLNNSKRKKKNTKT